MPKYGYDEEGQPQWGENEQPFCQVDENVMPIGSCLTSPWGGRTYRDYHCSRCHNIIECCWLPNKIKANFCSNCGGKIDKSA